MKSLINTHRIEHDVTKDTRFSVNASGSLGGSIPQDEQTSTPLQQSVQQPLGE